MYEINGVYKNPKKTKNSRINTKNRAGATRHQKSSLMVFPCFCFCAWSVWVMVYGLNPCRVPTETVGTRRKIPDHHIFYPAGTLRR